MNLKSYYLLIFLLILFSCSKKTAVVDHSVHETKRTVTEKPSNPYNAYNGVNRGMTKGEVIAKLGEPQGKGMVMNNELYHYCQPNDYNNFNLSVLFNEGKVIEVQRMVSKKTDYPDCNSYFSKLRDDAYIRLSKDDLFESLEKDGKVTIANFDIGKVEPKLSLNSQQILQLVKLINANKNAFYIVGHTNNHGSKEENLKLSIQRAASTIKLLEDEYGLKKGKLKPIGKGEESPLYDNNTEEGRKQNSRVEIVINY